ncbi:MAG: UDP-3-O-(3-hydroxymyristoyl)glucosamine N-acyltransferase [Verrucomicrobiales bacterium]|nr:UDP-3-O-(3-hydroxymyristoyl)glucosamine N-acyltransferase [Verrucomicrobiales bacterium]MCP5527616.1 UDP-3-O-(3-hydroxymyristoyl)glucosamine N-acyltransferase [Verrucomicrobiales bacterium]
MTYTARDLAEQLGGSVTGDETLELHGVSPATDAREGEVTFAENESYLARAEASAAAAVIVARSVTASPKTLIRVGNVRVGFARALALFHPEPAFAPGIHPSAVVDPLAEVDPTAHVGPLCWLGPRARVGARSWLLGGVQVGEDCVIGEDCRVFANVTLYRSTRLGNRVRIHAGTVVGADGFGYVLDQGQHLKIPQVGTVTVEDDVEIGANTTIDRGALGTTVVGRGTKIDNLVQVGHNVVLGEHCILVSQVGIAGSCTVGSHSVLAGQVGVAGHLNLGERVTVAAKSGVMNHIGDGEMWMGIPARPVHEQRRVWVAIQRAPEILRRLKAIEDRLESFGGDPPGSSAEPG